MSHTGQVNEWDHSPGMIRIITTGYFVRQMKQAADKKELVFRKPDVDPEDWNTNAEEAAHNRFIAYLPRSPLISFRKTRGFKYGDPVRFNIQDFDRWKQENSKSYKKHEKAFDALREKIPTAWRQRVGPGWNFKYIATKVRMLHPKFILGPFYRFIGDLDKDGMEEVLGLLNMLDRFDLQEPLRIKIKGDNRKVDAVRVWDAEKFDIEYVGASIEIEDWADTKKLKEDTANGGEHIISTESEMPNRMGRW